MLPNPSDLKYFLETYSTGNISRASERLGITQPSLSLSIKRLEELLDAKLFLRSKGGVIPTDQGHILAKNTQELMTKWEDLSLKTKSSIDQVKGFINIGCHPSVALYSLGPWFKTMINDYKDLNINLSHDLSRKVSEEVISFKTDIGIVVNPVSHPDLIIKHLFDDEVTLWKSKNKKFNEDVLILDTDLHQTKVILKSIRTDFKRQIKSSSLEVIASLTKLGTGVGILPGRVAGSELVKYNSSVKSFKDKICLIYRSDTPKTKTLMTVVDLITRNLK